MDYGLAFIGIVALVAVLVTIPLRHPGQAQARNATRREELEAAKEGKYREIHDAELDHSMGKLSDADWRTVDAELRDEAIEILRQIDRLPSPS